MWSGSLLRVAVGVDEIGGKLYANLDISRGEAKC